MPHWTKSALYLKETLERFPTALPEFFIRLLSDYSDLILDPFTGSNTTGAVAEKLQRRWIAIDNVEAYLNASKFRFE